MGIVLSGQLFQYNTIMPDGRVLADNACDRNDGKRIPVKRNGIDIGYAVLESYDKGIRFKFYPNNGEESKKIFKDRSFLTNWFNKKKKYFLSPYMCVLKHHKKSVRVIRRADIVYANWTEKPLPGGYINEIDEF